MNNFLIVVQRVLHSVLCSRVLLHIRSAYKAQQRHLIGDSLPPIVIAQITEPLNDSLWPSDHSESHNGRRSHSPIYGESDLEIQRSTDLANVQTNLT
ncbi:hypothetical protein BD410DRAFT_468610 [Rickenella mellea]|uniref:Uncharacterized protein n=1 Tax=Rickenella mellea TaxID=50990 RepID=A0A4Y7PDP1_9AGAM|nr:hypothetical protein BD410DRAFT_468610 [Rickenella mellea]